MPTLRSVHAKLAAERRGCLLEISETRANRLDLKLWAPDGRAFMANGGHRVVDLEGQGLARDEIDWSRVIEGIEQIVAKGFVPANDKDE